MATKKGTTEVEGYNLLPVIPGNKKVWFLNKDLVRIYHYNQSNGIMSVYNITKDQIESCLINEFKNKNSLIAMTGHLLFKNIDKILTLLPKVTIVVMATFNIFSMFVKTISFFSCF